MAGNGRGGVRHFLGRYFIGWIAGEAYPRAASGKRALIHRPRDEEPENEVAFFWSQDAALDEFMMDPAREEAMRFPPVRRKCRE
jgi:hypothetical protein